MKGGVRVKREGRGEGLNGEQRGEVEKGEGRGGA